MLVAFQTAGGALAQLKTSNLKKRYTVSNEREQKIPLSVREWTCKLADEVTR